MHRTPERQRELGDQAMSRLLNASTEQRDFMSPRLILVILAAIVIAVCLAASSVW